MAYEKLNLQDGQVLDAAALAHMEDGIEGAAAGSLPGGAGAHQQLVTDGEGNVLWENKIGARTVKGPVFEFHSVMGEPIDKTLYPMGFSYDTGEGPGYYATVYKGPITLEQIEKSEVLVDDSEYLSANVKGYGFSNGSFDTSPDVSRVVTYGDKADFRGPVFTVFFSSVEYTNYDGTTTTIEPGLYVDNGYDEYGGYDYWNDDKDFKCFLDVEYEIISDKALPNDIAKLGDDGKLVSDQVPDGLENEVFVFKVDYDYSAEQYTTSTERNIINNLMFDKTIIMRIDDGRLYGTTADDPPLSLILTHRWSHTIDGLDASGTAYLFSGMYYDPTTTTFMVCSAIYDYDNSITVVTKPLTIAEAT